MCSTILSGRSPLENAQPHTYDFEYSPVCGWLQAAGLPPDHERDCTSTHALN
jgi:hypothetical protein